jgi:LacI family transcriptional regulator
MHKLMSTKSVATISDVAQKAGVSTATVSRLINGIGPVSEETERRVRDAISELNYTPKRKRRGRGDSHKTGGPAASKRPIAFLRIGAFESQDRSPVTEHLVEALHRSAYALGRTMTVHYVPDPKDFDIREVIGDAEGVILRTSNIQEVRPQATEWLDGIPAVQVLGENRLGRLWVDHVTPDNVQAGALAADYLIRSGCDRLIFVVTNLQRCSVGMDRCFSFVRAAREAGKEVLVFAQSIEDNEQRFQQELSSLSAACQVVENRANLIREVASAAKGKFGLFIPTDLELAMVMPQLQMMGVDFNDGAHIIGCDHETRCFSGLDPMPATMDLHLDNIAARTIRRLIFRLEYPKEPLVRISVAPDLVLPQDVMNAKSALPREVTLESAGFDVEV